jgi:two-component system, NtrC family, response regulator
MDSTNPAVLIVEDDPGLQKQLKWSFGQYEVFTATDAEEALTIVRRHNPPVITMDLGLPPSPDTPAVGLQLLEDVMAISAKHEGYRNDGSKRAQQCTHRHCIRRI